jgi:hypothetical protein
MFQIYERVLKEFVKIDPSLWIPPQQAKQQIAAVF